MAHSAKASLSAGHNVSNGMTLDDVLEEQFRILHSAMSTVEDWGKPALKRQIDLALQEIAAHVRDYSAIAQQAAAIKFKVSTPRPGSTAGMSNDAAGELRRSVMAAEPSAFAIAMGRTWR